MEDLLQQLLDNATGSVDMTDPKVGKYEAATLSDISVDFTKAGNRKMITLTWSGLTSTDGFSFEQDQMLLVPLQDDLYFMHKGFWDTLSNLGVVTLPKGTPAPILSDGAVDTVVDKMREKIGSQYPLRISARKDSDFYNITVLRQPKQ